MSETASQPFASRFALAFIFMTMLVDTMGLGIIIPVAPEDHRGTDRPLCRQRCGDERLCDVGRLAADRVCRMLFLFSPLIGNLSDRFGRRPVLIISLLMLGVDYLITGLAPTIWWLFIGRILSGIAGATYTTANAYIADISPPEKRAANFGLTGAAFGIGFILGPALGGLIGEHGVRRRSSWRRRLPWRTRCSDFWCMKESLPPEKRRKFELWRANPVGSLMALKRYPMVVVLFVGVLS